ncbi:cholesterol 24-hydroxylase-like, partial [Argopecten irradians]|uniref:cholesterol 24-hydroxylase-like n=1 Tax=Argopecten irradians TaxID=31199 RepID=UPI003724063F
CIRQFENEFNEFANRYTQVLELSADGRTEVQTLDTFNKLTMHLIYKVCFHVELHVTLGPLDGHNHPFVTNMKTTFPGIAEQIVNPFAAINPLKWKFRCVVRESVNFIRQCAEKEMLDRKIAKRNGEYTPNDLLENIMELKEKHPGIITDDVLLDNFLTFIVAGQETLANALSFTLLLLAKNPECYNRFQQEVDENVGSISVVTTNEFEKLTYLDMVLKETLRLYPVAKTTFRETAKDYKLGAHCIPAGTDMMVSFYATSRVEHNVRDPTQFRPDRFDRNSTEKPCKYVSTPFSAGPHICIGKTFAEMAKKTIIIVKIMQNFEFELAPGQNKRNKGTMQTIQPKDGVKCYFRQRSNNVWHP